MKYAIAVVAVLFLVLINKNPSPGAQAATSQPEILTYQQLVDYPVDCELKDEQLAELLAVQRAKNFNPDSDELNESDYHYNSRLKATIWYYAYGCEK